MMVAMISSNTLQFQYFWDFNKFLQAIFSNEVFKISGYIFWVLGCFDSKLLKIIISHLLKSVN